MSKRRENFFSILLISNDPFFAETLNDQLSKEFRIIIYRFNHDEIRLALQVSKPILLIWDCTCLTNKEEYMINWLRDHFPKRAILAIIPEENMDIDERLCNKGVNLVLPKTMPDFNENLKNYVQAIISDLTKKCA